MKKSIALSFLLLSAVSHTALHAQTADEIQTLLQTPAVSYAQAARFVLEGMKINNFQEKGMK